MQYLSVYFLKQDAGQKEIIHFVFKMLFVWPREMLQLETWISQDNRCDFYLFTTNVSLSYVKKKKTKKIHGSKKDNKEQTFWKLLCESENFLIYFPCGFSFVLCCFFRTRGNAESFKIRKNITTCNVAEKERKRKVRAREKKMKNARVVR